MKKTRTFTIRNEKQRNFTDESWKIWKWLWRIKQKIWKFSKRLIELKFKNLGVQKDIKNWVFRVKENEKLKNQNILLKWGVKKKNIFIRYYFNNFRLFNTETCEKKEIKKAIISVPANFENNQRLMTILKQAKK